MKNKTIKNLSIVAVVLLILIIGLDLFMKKPVNPSRETNDTVYSDYVFWEKENEVRMVLPIDVEVATDDNEFLDTGDLELPRWYSSRAEILKKIMIIYFDEVYDIDISAKLENQVLKGFEFSGGDGLNETMGYVSEDNPNCLNLNNKLFGEYDMYFDNTYIHESLHQIGFRSEDSIIITEGIVDALTDLILCDANVVSYPTESYNDIRTLGYQILIADKDIVKFYLENENPSMIGRIDERLEDVKKTFLDVDPGIRLECLGRGLTHGHSPNFDSYYLAFEAQEIVRAYCQSFNPDKETIDQIRAFYLVTDYETVSIVEQEDGFNFYWDE